MDHYYLAEAFPVIKTCTYVNTPSSGLLSTPVVNFRNAYNQGILEDYAKIDYLADEKMQGIKQKIKKYVHATASEVGFISNFSMGMNLIADALPEGAKVLLLKGDYPSVNLPFESRKFQLDYVEIGADLEAQIHHKLEAFSPDYIALSLVQYMSGIKIDVDFLKAIKARFPQIHIIGDATQYLGTEDFHFDNSAFSVIGSSGYKWFHAGTGNAFFLLKNDFLAQLSSAFMGSNSLEFKPNGPVRKVGFLETGHYDMHSFQSLEVALDFHYQEIGISAIEKAIHELSNTAKKEFEKRGWLSEAVSQRKIHSNIFNLKGDEHTLRALQKQQVICAMRGNGIRVGFHYFNNQADLDKIITVLEANSHD